MTMPADPVEDLWSSVLGILAEDDRITPQLHGFLNLVEPKGVLAGTLYLEVPNDLTRGMLEQRIRIPITEAIGRIGDDAVANFAITVNPDMASEPRVDAPAATHVEAIARCPPSFYRYLYGEVGREWHWVDRLDWDDETIQTHLA